jgi:DNA-binding CsgD family transcriptional regulator
VPDKTKDKKFLFAKKEKILRLRAKGHSYAEIAKIQNLSVNTVKSKIRRSGIKLK